MRALLDTDGLDGASEAVRLAVLVLASRTPSESGVVEIRTSELGRWLGLSKSYTASSVVQWMRHSDVVEVSTGEGEFGEDSNLECKILPLWEAFGAVGHPLALSKAEFATLLRLLEALMAPGWVHRNGTVTPAGLLGSRTGRGAATDRLALLLLVLEARENGRVRLCGGTVDTKRGRTAATLARLMGCTASAAERVLERLEDFGVVERVRLRTGSDLAQRTRLMVPAVAAAHAPARMDRRREERAGVPVSPLSWPDATAMPGDTSSASAKPQVSEVEEGIEGLIAEPDVAATLHADHSSGADAGVDSADAGGFSGEGRGGNPGLPGRACEREGQAEHGQDAAAALMPPVAEVGPLRGEKPQESQVDEHGKQAVAGGKADVRRTAAGGGKAQQRRVGLPADLGLRVALGPVAWLWGQLSSWQQDQVQATAKAELVRLAGMLMRPEAAPQLLADRLTGRLKETGGEALVDRPYPWLLKRGLAQRPSCSDRRCDDGIRLDTGGDCENCASILHIRRAHRLCTGAEIDARMPGAGEDERKRAVEERMRQLADLEAEDFMWRREQAAAERARRAAVRAEDEERAERERQAAAAAEAARQVLPCADCGLPNSAGRCEACGYERRVQELLQEAEELSAASVDPADTQAAGRAVADVRDMLNTLTDAARRRYLDALEPGAREADPHGVRDLLAYTRRETLEQAVPQIRASVLTTLARSPEAEAEALRAYKTEQSRRWYRYNPNSADAIAAATAAARTARERTAEHLLTARLKQLRGQSAAPTAGPVSWADRLPELAARPLPDNTTRTVTA